MNVSALGGSPHLNLFLGGACANPPTSNFETQSVHDLKNYLNIVDVLKNFLKHSNNSKEIYLRIKDVNKEQSDFKDKVILKYSELVSKSGLSEHNLRRNLHRYPDLLNIAISQVMAQHLEITLESPGLYNKILGNYFNLISDAAGISPKEKDHEIGCWSEFHLGEDDALFVKSIVNSSLRMPDFLLLKDQVEGMVYQIAIEQCPEGDYSDPQWGTNNLVKELSRFLEAIKRVKDIKVKDIQTQRLSNEHQLEKLRLSQHPPSTDTLSLPLRRKRVSMSSTATKTNQHALVIIGGAGSGKNTVLDQIKGLSGIAYEIIDPDKEKEKIPEYKKMVERGDPRASSQFYKQSLTMRDQTFKDALKKKLSLAYVGSGSDQEFYRQVINQLKSNGYKVSLALVLTQEIVAQKRVKQRERESGRSVPIEFVASSLRDASRTFESLQYVADDAHKYDNNASGEPAKKLS